MGEWVIWKSCQLTIVNLQLSIPDFSHSPTLPFTHSRSERAEERQQCLPVAAAEGGEAGAGVGSLAAVEADRVLDGGGAAVVQEEALQGKAPEGRRAPLV